MAPFLSYGMRKGAAVTNDWNTDMAFALKNEALDRQAQVAQEAKTKLASADFKFAKAENSWDKALLKPYLQEQISAIGKWATEHPNHASSLGETLQLKKMTDGLLNNDIAERALRVDTHYDSLMKYAKDNPEDLDDPTSDVNKMLLEYSNYQKIGSIDGVTANGKEFTYTQPMKFDMAKDVGTIAGLMKGDTKTWSKGGMYGLTQFYSDDEVDANVSAYVTKNSKKISREFEKLPASVQSYYGTSYDWVYKTLKSNLKEGPLSISQYHVASSSGSGDKTPTTTRWQTYKSALEAGYGYANKANMTLTFNKKQGDKYYLTPSTTNGKYQLYLPDKNGALAKLDFKSSKDILITDAGAIKYDENGKPAYVSTTIRVPDSSIDADLATKVKMREALSNDLVSYTKNETGKVLEYDVLGTPVKALEPSWDIVVWTPYNPNSDGNEWGKLAKKNGEGELETDVSNIDDEAYDYSDTNDVNQAHYTDVNFSDYMTEAIKTDPKFKTYTKAQQVLHAKKNGYNLIY